MVNGEFLLLLNWQIRLGFGCFLPFFLREKRDYCVKSPLNQLPETLFLEKSNVFKVESSGTGYLQIFTAIRTGLLSFDKVLTKRRTIRYDFANSACRIVVDLNVAEGCSRSSECVRKRYYEIARGSVIEIDAALDAANDLGYLVDVPLDALAESMVKCFKILSGMIDPKHKKQFRE